VIRDVEAEVVVSISCGPVRGTTAPQGCDIAPPRVHRRRPEEAPSPAATSLATLAVEGANNAANVSGGRNLHWAILRRTEAALVVSSKPGRCHPLPGLGCVSLRTGGATPCAAPPLAPPSRPKAGMRYREGRFRLPRMLWEDSTSGG
jgi:hypothetical protein